MNRLEEHRRKMQRKMFGQEVARCERHSDRQLERLKSSVLHEQNEQLRLQNRLFLLKIINAYNLGEFNEGS